LLLGGRLEVDERRDAELLPDPGRGLRAEAGQAREEDDLGRDRVLALGERLDLAGLDDLDDLLLDRLADSLQALGLALESELGDRAGGLANPLCGTTVGERAEGVGALELEQVGEEVELVGDLVVPGRWFQSRASSRGCDGRCEARTQGAFVSEAIRARLRTPPRAVQRSRAAQRLALKPPPSNFVVATPAMIRRVPRATVCLPTYDERENLEPMVRALGEVLSSDDRVLVIDDNSPDGTGEIADRLAAELDWVDVLHRPRKEGLGRAYLDGFRLAMERGSALVLEMDCDFSHDPADLPRLIAAADDADLVLGSRYVPGGGTQNWGLVRRAISRWGSLYAQLLLGLPVRDLTGGFKCYRREVLETIDLDAIRSRGSAFQIETTYRAVRAGFRVVEVPIRFTDREVGGSKMSRAIVAEAIWKVPALRLAALGGRL
jgi:dolichol-phosphate mannosyltransferase